MSEEERTLLLALGSAVYCLLWAGHTGEWTPADDASALQRLDRALSSWQLVDREAKPPMPDLSKDGAFL
jgi:hypothetical protein